MNEFFRNYLLIGAGLYILAVSCYTVRGIAYSWKLRHTSPTRIRCWSSILRALHDVMQHGIPAFVAPLVMWLSNLELGDTLADTITVGRNNLIALITWATIVLLLWPLVSIINLIFIIALFVIRGRSRRIKPPEMAVFS